MYETLEEAFKLIIWYDCLYEWLEELADKIEKSTEYFKCPLSLGQWHTEEHFVYMLLVGMFGDWGTSIRGGWIEQKKECVEYIRKICKEMREMEEMVGETDGIAEENS